MAPGGARDLAEAERALSADDLKSAYALLAPRLAAHPDDRAALHLMARLARRMRRPLDAARMIGRAIALDPACEADWHMLADLLHHLPPAEALAEIERQCAARRDLLGLAGLRAAMLERAGRFEAAIAQTEAIAKAQPRLAAPRITLGYLYKTIGRVDDAIAAYRDALTLEPARAEAWWALADLKTYHFTPAEVAAMAALLESAAPTGRDRIHLGFALGWAHEQAGAHADAFAAYAAANRLHRTTIRHDVAQLPREIAGAAQLFTPGFFAARAGWGDDAPDPIFVVGLPRAGSTLVEQILASHPAIEATMELGVLPQLVERIARGPAGYPDALAALPRDAVAALGRAYIAQTRINRRTARPHFVDKLPANFRFIGLIRLILPRARIIDVRRDPLANGVALFRQYMASGHSFAFDLAEIGAYQQDYARMMALWDARLPGHVHHLTYERLVDDIEAEVRALLAYLRLPFDPACLRFHETRRAVRTPSSGQVRQPIHRRGTEDWRGFEPWLGPLKAALGR